MRQFTLYNNGTSTLLQSNSPLMGEAKDREIESRLSIIDIAVKLSERNHIFDVVFWLDGDHYGIGQLKRLEEALNQIDSSVQPTAKFLSQKDFLTLVKFSEMY